MGRIVSIKTNYIIARQDDGKIQMIPKAECSEEFAVGDIVDIVVDGSKITLIKKGSAPVQPSFKTKPAVSAPKKTIIEPKNDTLIVNDKNVRDEQKTNASSENLELKTSDEEKLSKESSSTASQIENDDAPSMSFFEKFKLLIRQKDVKNVQKPNDFSENLELKTSDEEKLSKENSSTASQIKNDDAPATPFFEKLKLSIHQKITSITDKIREIFKKPPNRTVNLNLQLNEEKLSKDSTPTAPTENITEPLKEGKIDNTKNNTPIVEQNIEKPKTESTSEFQTHQEFSVNKNKSTDENSIQSIKSAVTSIPGGRVVEIKDNVIAIMKDNGNIQEIPKSHFNFEPTVGDIVDVFSNGTKLIIVKKIPCK